MYGKEQRTRSVARFEDLVFSGTLCDGGSSRGGSLTGLYVGSRRPDSSTGAMTPPFTRLRLCLFHSTSKTLPLPTSVNAPTLPN